VELKKIFPIAAAIIIGGTIASCKLDPWITEEKPTNIVTITKTAKLIDKEKSEDKAYKSHVGAVKISHKVHEEQGLKCIDCHHKNINGKNANPAREKKCAVCHYGENGYETLHGLCVDCHIKKKAGPQKCKECH
jgi:hypothetical protein